ncbi:adenosylcobinamide-phosphate synthase CbiB [Candidatus Nitrospira bockiana]
MTPGQLLAACVLDGLIGDPAWMPHPVRLMGRVVSLFERLVRPRLAGPSAKRVAGVVLAIGLPLTTAVVGWAIIEGARKVHPAAEQVVIVLLSFTVLAARDLGDHAWRVLQALEAGSLPSARDAVGRIVGRDTEQLTEREVVRATVETVAESTCDGIIAPLFYLTLGGPVLALSYKAINTLDSLIGHRDETYEQFGWASARLDDMVNWIPARLTAVLMVVAGGLYNGSLRRAWRIVLRDGGRHPSPNSGRSEAAMAGALGIQLGGRNTYGGMISERPTLGEPLAPLGRHHIKAAVALMSLTTGLAVALATVVLAVRS